MKKLFAVMCCVTFLMPLAVAAAGTAEETAQTGIVDVGNKMCPVMGGPVSGNDFVIYQGKRYGLCCPGCETTFLNDPEKYMTKMKEQEPVPTKGTAAPIVDPASAEMQRDMEQGSL